MYYFIQNHITGKPDCVESEELANAKLIENRNAYMQQESYRFTVAKEIVDGNNTIWMSADLENDIEDYDYQVFNQFTGQHEKINGLSNAKARLEEIKQQFIVEVGLDKWVSSTLADPSNKYGVIVGDIPVEVM